MNYTIAILDDIHNDISVELVKSGNKYLIGLYSYEKKEYTCKEFDSRDEAFVLFNKLSEAICKGWYSYEQRKQLFL